MGEEFEKWKKTEQGKMLKNIALISDSNMYLIFSAGQKAEADKHRWISVTERLPKKGFVIAKDIQNVVTMVFYNGSYFGLNINGMDCKIDPVYWQPLPE